MKKVIFVGGAAYSGTTLLDLTLANDPAGFSCGEVYAMFHPFRPHYVDPLCGCADHACEIWPRVLAAGEDHLYETISALEGNPRFIVDSSKDPFWIARQSERLRRAGVQVKHILIWKTPLELAHSYKKRGNTRSLERSWTNYYRLYHSLIPEWRSISYADLAGDASVLPDICAFLEIPYFEGKEEYWTKKHHLLFGNESARVHLPGNPGTGNGEPESRPDSQDDEPELQTVCYRPVEDRDLERAVAATVENSIYMSDIAALLVERDIRNPEPNGCAFAEHVKMGTRDLQLRKLKRAISYGIGRLRYSHR